MTDDTLEEIILGHIAKELKDEIQIGRQVNLAKTIMQALRIHDVVGRSEQLKAFVDFAEWYKDEYKQHIPIGAIKEYVKSL